jgi:hypothetical protein
MRNNLRSPEKALRLASSIEPLAETFADTELLKDRSRPAQFEKQEPQDAADGQRWMPASAIALAGGVSLLLWGLLAAWVIRS